MQADLIETLFVELGECINRDRKQCSLFDGDFSAHQGFCQLVYIGGTACSSEETQMTKIDAKNRDTTRAYPVDGTEQGAITSNGDDKVDSIVGKHIMVTTYHCLCPTRY